MIDTDAARAAFRQVCGYATRMTSTAVEVRESQDGSTFRTSGFASVTDSPYIINDWFGEYDETVTRGAFGKALRENDDVRLLINHSGVPLARTKSGTLTLSEVMSPDADPQQRGQTGLWHEADIDARSPLGQTLRSALERGDMGEMSFAFAPTRQDWNDDYTQRTIREVKLYDVSVVTYPANPATSVQMNSADLAQIIARGKFTPEQVEYLSGLAAIATELDKRPDMDGAMEPREINEAATDSEQLARENENRARRARFLASLK